LEIEEGIMHALDKTSWEIMDATADDWESLEQIYQTVCFEFSAENYEARDAGAYYLRPARAAVLLEEIADRIRDLVAAGLLAACWGDSGKPVTDLDDLSYVWRAWFSMTPQGRSAWEAYDNLVEQE
jgi:hypothetical protein